MAQTAHNFSHSIAAHQFTEVERSKTYTAAKVTLQANLNQVVREVPMHEGGGSLKM